MSLAGVYVHGQDKAGRDAGELCGLASTGVTATASIDEIVELGPDCVLYMPNSLNLDDLCRLLTSIQRQLNTLAIDEYADLSQRNSPELLFDLMGFGRLAGPFEQFRADYLRSSFGPSLRLVADAIGLPLESVEASGELAMASRETAIAEGTLTVGSVAAQRITISGIRAGLPMLQFRATWYCTTDLDPAWEVRETGWHVSVDGDAPLEATLRMPIPLDRMAAVSPAYTANRAVDAVPYVCAAAPGIHSTSDLPQVVAALA
jgi:2,4-diaminopentanoate dehydrogenase